MPTYTVICQEPTYNTWSAEIEAEDQFAALKEAERERFADDGWANIEPSGEPWAGLENEYVVESGPGDENEGKVLLTQHNPDIDALRKEAAFAEAFRKAWPALVDPEDDSEVNGSDLVEWCANWWAETAQGASL